VSKRLRDWMAPLWAPLGTLAVLLGVLAVFHPQEPHAWTYIAAAGVVAFTVIIALRSIAEDFVARTWMIQESFDSVRREHARRLDEIDGTNGRLEKLETGHEQHRVLLQGLSSSVRNIEKIPIIHHHLPPPPHTPKPTGGK